MHELSNQPSRLLLRQQQEKLLDPPKKHKPRKKGENREKITLIILSRANEMTGVLSETTLLLVNGNGLLEVKSGWLRASPNPGHKLYPREWHHPSQTIH